MALTDPARLVATLADEIAARAPEVHKWESYFAGKQGLAFASDAWAKYNRERGVSFSDNWSATVCTSSAERIQLTGIRVGTDSDIVSDNERDLMLVWDNNQMDAQSAQGFLHTIVTGRSYVMVWPGKSGADPIISWERADQVTVMKSEETREPLYALKTWRDGDYQYATLYSADFVYKYERKSTKYYGAESFHDGWVSRDVDGEAWPMKNPMGILPIVEVLNRPTLGGVSTSDIEVVADLQDSINAMWTYLLAAADYASMPARVIMGGESPQQQIVDSDGADAGELPVDMDALSKGRMLWLSGDASVGQWDSADLSAFSEVITQSVQHLAAQTKVPLQYVIGELTNINSETLIASETGLVQKCEEFKIHASMSMRLVFQLIAQAQGKKDLADQMRSAEILWRDSQTRTMAQASDAAVKDRAVGFPFSWVAANRYGLAPDQVEKVMALREEEAIDLLEGDLSLALGSKPLVTPVDSATELTAPTADEISGP